VSYQPVRGLYQKLTHDALVAAGVPAANINFDNYGETAAPADQSYALIAMNFGSSIEDVVGCEGMENLLGTLQVNIYTPKQTGSKPGEDIGLAVIKAWNGMNKRTYDPTPLLSAHTLGIEGPITIAPDQRPHHVNVVSCSFRARVA